MRKADQSLAPVALVIGDDEAAGELVTLKQLRADAPQQQIPLDQLADQLSDLLYAMDDDDGSL